MNTLTAYIDGIGLLGPGFKDWPSGRAILAGQAAYLHQPTVLPPAAALPPAERRRCGPIVKLSLAVGFEAAAAAGLDSAGLPTVFSASSGDGDNCHQICQMLASDDRQISPTRFHNSVHNAAAGYWAIAAKAMAPSSVLGAHDASFGAGLLEALSQVMVDHASTLLIACDSTYPEPLHRARPVPAEFGIGLVLAPQRCANSLARIRVALTSASAEQMADRVLENLRAAIPAARGLPLLHAIANRASTRLVIDYLDSTRLAVEIDSWA
ncbi:beta-ketoacyl synthase chain length factor [Herminiimonas sp. CN]|uniref:beta-ketoacyl synthase chain length factor n=1 Tax=Herminiimonas sp. CN TaxID=1349818 RepID=UPI00047412EB|nr:beta-ketoacyl synthase chain length factor [Herminiimonas sp. CN]